MQDDTTLAVPALAMPVDGQSELVRLAVRGAIEVAVEAELALGSGPTRWWVGGAPPQPALVTATESRVTPGESSSDRQPAKGESCPPTADTDHRAEP